jgi:hypothetical protein
MPGGLAQGALIAGGTGLALLLLGVMATAFGFAATGLALAGFGAFGARVSGYLSILARRLRREEPGKGTALMAACDLLAGASLWFALAPYPVWQPLAALGPVAIALVAVAARSGDHGLAVAAGDRASLLLLLALCAALGFLPEAIACLALGLCTALLLRRGEE